MFQLLSVGGQNPPFGPVGAGFGGEQGEGGQGPTEGLEEGPPRAVLTCRATVKWLVLVSRTMLVFMADWMPQRHCR